MEHWTNGVDGRVIGGVHHIRASDARELAAAINRRRAVTFQAPWDCSAAGVGRIDSGLTAGALAPPRRSFRDEVLALLAPPDAAPPGPRSMRWLWPLADGDGGKVIVAGNAQAGEVALLSRIAGGNWTDPQLVSGVTPIRAAHVNELRAAIEALVRGRWVGPNPVITLNELTRLVVEELPGRRPFADEYQQLLCTASRLTSSLRPGVDTVIADVPDFESFEDWQDEVLWEDDNWRVSTGPAHGELLHIQVAGRATRDAREAFRESVGAAVRAILRLELALSDFSSGFMDSSPFFPPAEYVTCLPWI
jgi:hypothetical protein